MRAGVLRSAAAEAIAQERIAQDQRWGKQRHTAGDWILILAEELGELSKELLEGDRKASLDEAIQTAAVAQAIVEHLIEQPVHVTAKSHGVAINVDVSDVERLRRLMAEFHEQGEAEWIRDLEPIVTRVVDAVEVGGGESS